MDDKIDAMVDELIIRVARAETQLSTEKKNQSDSDPLSSGRVRYWEGMVRGCRSSLDLALEIMSR